jgi:hypothetical protein
MSQVTCEGCALYFQGWQHKLCVRCIAAAKHSPNAVAQGDVFLRHAGHAAMCLCMLHCCSNATYNFCRKYYPPPPPPADFCRNLQKGCTFCKFLQKVHPFSEILDFCKIYRKVRLLQISAKSAESLHLLQKIAESAPLSAEICRNLRFLQKCTPSLQKSAENLDFCNFCREVHTFCRFL